MTFSIDISLEVIVLILTLAVVTYQLMQNTKQMRSQNYLEVVKNHRELWSMAFQHDELETLFGDSSEPFSSKEKRFLSLLLIHLQTVYDLHKRDNIIEIEKIKFDVRDSFQSDRAKEFWNSHRKFANKEFSEFMDSILYPN